MIRKLAEELASNPTVAGENDVAPIKDVSPPATKPDALPDPDHGFTSHSREGHARTNHGFLSRALGNYDTAARDHESVLSEVLGDHVRQVTGSSMMSQRAVRRFQGRKR